jgi:hypothetical protein
MQVSDDPGAGWKWLYTRRYNLSAPQEYAFQWMSRHAPLPELESKGREQASERARRIERRSYPDLGIDKVTEWELTPADQAMLRDLVYQKGRLVFEGLQQYRFLGSHQSGCIAEVTAWQRPVGWVGRLGFALLAKRAVRSHGTESVLLKRIETDFRDSR